MNRPSIKHKLSITECKIQAAILLKSLRSTDNTVLIKAVKRFKKMTDLNNLTTAEIIKQAKLKHALAVIAHEKGFNSWLDLKIQLNFIIGGYLNHWFASYDEAKSYQKIHGGFLLPYRHQFFICSSEYINQLKLDAEDPDWVLIGEDWSRPKEKSAWQRLYKKWMKIQEGRGHV